MPITFAHPAAVIPFKYINRRYYSWTGLIIGSIIPDFEAFVKLGGMKQLSHSWVGMFVFDLPLGLLVALIFHAIVRDVLLDNLPPFISYRFSGLRHINWHQTLQKRWAVIIVSLLFGIFTHLVWDRFTHTDTYTYHHKAGINIAPDMETTIRRWLQWTNTIGGLLLIIRQISLLPVVPVKRVTWGNYWSVVITTSMLLFCIRMNFFYEGDDLINTIIAGLLLGIILASLLFRSWKKEET